MPAQFTRIFFFFTGAVLFASAVALAEKPKTINIYANAVLPSGETIKAGKYQVEVNEGAKQVTFRQQNKVVATSRFEVVQNPQKNTCNQARFGQKENKQELQELRFGGENRSIVLLGSGSADSGAQAAPAQ